MTGPIDRIDVHHHIIPPTLAAAMAKRGIHTVAGAKLPSWSPEDSVSLMDRFGIATAITSVSSPGVYFGDKAEACALARSANEFAAGLRALHPGRFGAFAVLPMPFVAEACAEAAYALDVLKADGVVLLGSTEGIFLGDPQFEELMAELDRRKAVVFIHPNIHPTSNMLSLETPGYLVEFLCDTTRAATNLILSGAVERYPHIRFILAHAGGFLPYIAWRLALTNDQPKFVSKIPKGMLHYIRSFYYDTALSPSPFAMAALRQLVDPTHILFGSDFPFAPSLAVGLEIKTLSGLDVLSPEDKQAIRRSNALSLFPDHAAGVAQKSTTGLGAHIGQAVTDLSVGLGKIITER